MLVSSEYKHCNTVGGITDTPYDVPKLEHRAQQLVSKEEDKCSRNHLNDEYAESCRVTETSDTWERK